MDHVWFLDPIGQTLEVLTLDEGRWVIEATFAGDARVRARPFDAIEIELVQLWGESRTT